MMGQLDRPVTFKDIVDEAGGVDALVEKWLSKRAFPWHPDGFIQRSERRESRFRQVQWPVMATDEPDTEEREAFCIQHAAAEGQLDAECRRYVRIFQADEDDNFSALSHSEFCDTAYWFGLSRWMKQQAKFTCADCHLRAPDEKGLEVHHKTYRHRGQEYPDHLSDLVVLCGDCHGRRHGKPRRTR